MTRPSLAQATGLRKCVRTTTLQNWVTYPCIPVLATTQTEAVPSQSWEDTHAQWNGGANDGFVRSAANQPGAEDATLAMGYWNENDLPFYYGLARTFPVADRWFSSCLGPTFPNRRFLVAGTAHGLTTDALSECFDRAANGTIFATRGKLVAASALRTPRSRPRSGRAPRRTSPGRRLRTS